MYEKREIHAEVWSKTLEEEDCLESFKCRWEVNVMDGEEIGWEGVWTGFIWLKVVISSRLLAL
jgi:hypothetical protein